jgi:hypothetical protein
MNHKDLIKQYVDTGVKIPEYQTMQLSGADSKTYVRKRLISVRDINNLEYYEQEIYFKTLSEEELKPKVIKEFDYIMEHNGHFNIYLYKALTDEWKLRVIKVHIDNDIEISDKILDNSSEEIKSYYLNRVMSEGLNIYIGLYLDFSEEEQIQYFKSLIRNKTTGNGQKWYKLMPDNLKLEYSEMFIEDANERNRLLPTWVKDSYKDLTGKNLVRLYQKYIKQDEQ